MAQHRKCPLPGCGRSLVDLGRRAQARWCSDACKQAAYRMRKAGDVDQEDNEPTARFDAPAAAGLEAAGDGWRVTLEGGQVVEVPGPCSAGQARARARWSVARRVG